MHLNLWCARAEQTCTWDLRFRDVLELIESSGFASHMPSYRKELISFVWPLPINLSGLGDPSRNIKFPLA